MLCARRKRNYVTSARRVQVHEVLRSEALHKTVAPTCAADATASEALSRHATSVSYPDRSEGAS
eukprot:545740-Pyramimonas_sp.AAC.1